MAADTEKSVLKMILLMINMMVEKTRRRKGDHPIELEEREMCL